MTFRFFVRGILPYETYHFIALYFSIPVHKTLFMKSICMDITAKYPLALNRAFGI